MCTIARHLVPILAGTVIGAFGLAALRRAPLTPSGFAWLLVGSVIGHLLVLGVGVAYAKLR